MNDFTLDCSAKFKKSAPLEADSLMEVLQALRTHSGVARVRRQNTGAAKVGGMFIKVGRAGCTKLIGMMKDGRLLALECIRPNGGRLSTEQTHFIDMVNQFGGCAFVATNLHDVLENLGSSND